MKLVLSLLAVGFFLAACGSKQTHADVRQKVLGTWIPDANPNFLWKIEQRPGGSNFSVHGCGPSQGWASDGGTWQITKDFFDRRFLVLTMTNSSWENGTLGVRRYRVIQIDDHEMTLLRQGADTYEKVHKQ